jgi:cyclopropane-fatty-acyl-phospholipid synthase
MVSQTTTSMSASILDHILQRIQNQVSKRIKIPFEIHLWGDRTFHFGEGSPCFQVQVNGTDGLAALASLDELKICEAYMAGHLDLAGNMLQVASLHKVLGDRHPLHHLWRAIPPLLMGQVKVDRQSIAQHYELEHEFYLSFMDPSRCYSHALFETDDEPLAMAMQRKLAFALTSVGVKPGDRVLDVGGGWGTFTEYAGQQGIHVTSLTISRQSEAFISDLIQQQQLPCRVLFQNFWEHQPEEKYDAVVILGVLEHLPSYRKVLQHLETLLKPGGRIYADASAFRHKYVAPTFITRYIYPGNHSFFCLHDFLAALTDRPFELLEVYGDRHSYYLTCKAWAEAFEANRDYIISRWGEAIYRRFRLFLWGSTSAFLNRGLEAYRVVLELKP